MMHDDRKILYRQFVDRFRPATGDYKTVSVTHGDIDAAEYAVQRKFPASYRTFVTEFAAGELDVPADSDYSVEEIWQPELIVRQIESEWWVPIPASVTGAHAIASDVAWKHLTPFASERSDGYWF